MFCGDVFAFESFCFHDVQPLGLLMPFRWCAVGPNLAAVEASLSSRAVPGRKGFRRETMMSLGAVPERHGTHCETFRLPCELINLCSAVV